MFVWVVFLIYLLNLWWLEFVDVIGFIVVWVILILFVYVFVLVIGFFVFIFIFSLYCFFVLVLFRGDWLEGEWLLVMIVIVVWNEEDLIAVMLEWIVGFFYFGAIEVVLVDNNLIDCMVEIVEWEVQRYGFYYRCVFEVE